MGTPLAVDRSSDVPLYQQLTDQLRSSIEQGGLQPGDRIENEEHLARRLSLSRPTVARAINQLVDAGLLLRRRGFGTEVSPSVRHRRPELTSLWEDLQRNGRAPGTRVLTLEHRLDPRAAALLGRPPTEPLWHLRRLRLAGPTPVAVMENWLPAAIGVLTHAELSSDGLYSVLRDRGCGPAAARQRIGAKAATAADAELLQVRRGTPLMTMESLAFDDHEVPVECGTHVYRADVYSIEVMVRT